MHSVCVVELHFTVQLYNNVKCCATMLLWKNLYHQQQFNLYLPVFKRNYPPFIWLSSHTLHINTAQIKECLSLAFLEMKIWLYRSQWKISLQIWRGPFLCVPSIIYWISAVNTQHIQRPDVFVQLGYIWRHVSAVKRPSWAHKNNIVKVQSNYLSNGTPLFTLKLENLWISQLWLQYLTWILWSY